MKRRSFVQLSLQVPVVGLLASSIANQSHAQSPAPPSRDFYSDLGIPTLINAGEPFTALSGAPVRSEVKDAMRSCETKQARIVDVQDAVGRRLAQLLGCEAAMVTAGAASGVTLGIAACMTGNDKARISRIPDSIGMANEVILQKAHRYEYEHAIRACGAKIIEVETVAELSRPISPRTACLLFNNRWNARGQIKHEEFVALGKKHGVPTFNDCASDAPPAENLTKFTKMGFDLVTFSGGKNLRGPTSTGLLSGRRDLIEAAKLNHAPYDDAIGRGMKVSKDEMIGLLVAVELCLREDPDPLFTASEKTLRAIGAELSAIPGVSTELFQPPVSYRAPHLRITWDEAKRGLTADEARNKLRDGSPVIMTRHRPDPVIGLEITSWMLAPGDIATVTRRIREVLGG